MGACILCGKSAGLFYSLHKNCYQLYQSSSAPIISILENQLGHEASADLAQRLHMQVEKLDFTEEARQRILVRALEKFAKQQFRQEEKIGQTCQAWISLLEQLKLDAALFIDPEFLDRQRELPVIDSLYRGILPHSNCSDEQFPLVLKEQEKIWWCFEDVSVNELQPPQKNRQWSVAVQILEGILPRRKKSSLQKTELGRGILWLTSQQLCLECDGKITSIAYRDIMTLTPEYDGVTIQTNERQALPATFRCKQGRLLYRFLQYANVTSVQRHTSICGDSI